MSNKGLEKGPEHIPDEIIGLGIVLYFRSLPDELKRTNVTVTGVASDENEMIF